MRTCQLFSLTVVSLFVLAAGGCATTPVASKATGVQGANAPIAQMMQAMQGSQETFRKVSK